MDTVSCRFCGKSQIIMDPTVATEDFICLLSFEEHQQNTAEQLNLLQKVNAFLPIEISESDGLSKKICSTCANKTNSTYEFIQMILDTQKRNTININTEIINENLIITERIKKLPNIDLKRIRLEPQPQPQPPQNIELTGKQSKSTNVLQAIEKLQKLSNRLTISKIKSPTTELFEFFDIKSTNKDSTIEQIQEFDRDDDDANDDDDDVPQYDNDNNITADDNNIVDLINSETNTNNNNNNNNNVTATTDIEIIDVMDLKYEYIDNIIEDVHIGGDLKSMDQLSVVTTDELPTKNRQKRPEEEEEKEEGIQTDTNNHNNNNNNIPKKTYTTKRSNKCVILKMDEPAAYVCIQCQYKFPSFELLKEHINNRLTTCKSSIILKCEICEKVFETKKSLKQHTLHVHRERPQYVCDECGKTYTNSFNLENHKASIHDNGLMQTNNNNNNNHCGGYSTYNCTICDNQFTNQKDLLAHKRNHIKEPSVHLCDTCGKCCSSIEILRSHIRIHLDIRPFSCTYCSKKYRSRLALTQHLHTHTGIKPFVCDVCAKAFAKKESLVSHGRVHTGIPYSFDCTICPLKFNKPKKLKNHLKIHEPQQNVIV